MLDRYALALLKPTLDAAAAALARRGVRADAVTVLGLVPGLGAAAAVSQQAYGAGLLLLLANRVADGLDGPIARHHGATDRGAFLDSTADFVFYASMPLAFAVADPAHNALAAATLLAAFIGTGTSFLAFAVLAERRGLAAAAYRDKGFYYLGGLTEGTETVACFVAMCVWPAHFPVIAYVFAAMCGLTWMARLAAGWRLLSDAQPPS
jgi:phosphatidylglycerophosphate synthase